MREYCGSEFIVQKVVLDHHLDRYTMQSERVIHHSIADKVLDGSNIISVIEADNSCGIEIFDENARDQEKNSIQCEDMQEDDIEFF